ncbi:MAG: hypothetical protein ACPGRW_06250 [Flavobacteriaceae bacterium]
MKTTEKKVSRINVSPSSTEGHFIEEALNVIELDKVTEVYKVEGKSRMATKKHTTLEINEDCLITCQNVYNPFTRMFEKAKD